MFNDSYYSPSSIVVIIATSQGRTELLLNRSLRSVYEQENVNSKVIVVDDNPIFDGMGYSKEFETIKEGIKELRKAILIQRFERFKSKMKNTDLTFKDYFPTTLLKNNRAKGNSGTGAWNTAIYHLESTMEDQLFYISILDDDDEYKTAYLSSCLKSIQSSRSMPAAIFTPIIWKGDGFEEVHYIDENKLTQKDFFIGNPGVQGSNMCFRSDILFRLKGFDENLPSTTDRDLMIRFLDLLEENYGKHPEQARINVTKIPLVVHHAYGKYRVTDNNEKKRKGLDIFYSKYIPRFSNKDLTRSLERARRLFGYEPQ